MIKRSTLLTLLVTIFVPISASASAFVLTRSQYENLPLADKQCMNAQAEQLLSLAHMAHRTCDNGVPVRVVVFNGHEMIQIDDVLVDIATLRKYRAILGERWPNGVVRYNFSAGVSERNRNAWRMAAALWSACDNLTFVESNSEHHILVKTGSENRSEYGMQVKDDRNFQTMEIETWDNVYVIAHEIGHALGLVHEHQRMGRGSAVELQRACIERHHWTTYFEELVSVNHGDYDFGSIMHPAPNIHFDPLSTDCPDGLTLVPLTDRANNLRVMGQRSTLTTHDLSGMRKEYPCPK